MQFLCFYDKFPELVYDLTILNVFNNTEHKHIPSGDYQFLEMFCNDVSCDCRKVIIQVMAMNSNEPWALLSYCWESNEYYQFWLGSQNVLHDMQHGVSLITPNNNLGNDFLTIFRDVITHYDVEFTTKLERHYRLFKNRIYSELINTPKVKSNERAGSGFALEYYH